MIYFLDFHLQNQTLSSDEISNCMHQHHNTSLATNQAHPYYIVLQWGGCSLFAVETFGFVSSDVVAH